MEDLLDAKADLNKADEANDWKRCVKGTIFSRLVAFRCLMFGVCFLRYVFFSFFLLMLFFLMIFNGLDSVFRCLFVVF